MHRLGSYSNPANERSTRALLGVGLALEGVLLFAILWIYASRTRPMGAVSGAFLLGYGVMRFVAEFAREPDAFLGLLALGFTMGQWLSLPMILIGLAMLFVAYRQRQPSGNFNAS